LNKQKHLVVSAVNLIEGGTLTVLIDSLEIASKCLPLNWKITALVHHKSLINNIPRVQIMEFPQSKRSWLSRIWLEWFQFNKLSQALKPDLWLSLHDITPRVQARRQAVYCHNSSPFYRMSWHEARLDPKFALFNLFYGQLYRVFISRNQAVVVQQEWLRQAFMRIYGHSNVVVAYPSKKLGSDSRMQSNFSAGPFNTYRPLVMLYPAFPRVFKNVEILCEAVNRLPPEISALVELRLTVSGTENAYARDLYHRYSSVPGVRFLGRQTRQQMDHEYQNCDVVLFPSKLESWGLPITEAKAYGKPLVVANLPYAHETVGNCDAVTFLPAHDVQAWEATIHQMVARKHTFGKKSHSLPEEPFAADWFQLWSLLIRGL